jgi:hypothetical protein
VGLSDRGSESDGQRRRTCVVASENPPFTVWYRETGGRRWRSTYPDSNRDAAAGDWHIAAVRHGCGRRLDGREPVRDVDCDRGDTDA